ncbi:MAG TPA: radical SAM protein [Acidobacteriota bacterium]|nr:radical SAM protein [Acidobacteriota bacterium]
MRKLQIGIIDLVSKSAHPGLWARVMNANFASIMPQVVASWCETQGHDVTLVCHTGFENLLEELPAKPDLVFIGAFTEAAHLAYAISNLLQSRGAITALGGPHARCYPQDARRYFDYVLGFTDQDVIRDVLQDCTRHRPFGVHLSAKTQPTSLPGVHERWRFVEATLRKAPTIKIVPMIGSLGCPYSCSFCIDASVPYQPIDPETIKDDLRFLLTKFRRPHVGWHDPNFGIRFDESMQIIEDAVPPDRIDFIAESTLSLLSEDHVKRMKRNGFKALLPGIESWYEHGGKSKTGKATGMEKVREVSDQVNMILGHVPYMQTNFVLGLDSDEGTEPFELTKRFLDMSPGVFPAFSLLTSFGRAAPVNLEYQRTGRILPFPFHVLNNHHAMNVRVKNYTWPEFYSHIIDLSDHAFSRRMMARRLRVNGLGIPGGLNLIRALSSEGGGRIRYFRSVRWQLDTDRRFRAFHDQDSLEVPPFYSDRIRADLGSFWELLPDDALRHDPNEYLNSHMAETAAGLLPAPAVDQAAVAAPLPSHEPTATLDT